MGSADNFEKLKEQLKELGFTAPGLQEDLTQQLKGDSRSFTISYKEAFGNDELKFWFDYEQKANGQDYAMKYFTSALLVENDVFEQDFKPDITRREAIAVLYLEHRRGLSVDWEGLPMTRADLRSLPLPDIVEHGIYRSVDTLELDEAMSKHDWHQHPGHFVHGDDDINDRRLMKMRTSEAMLDMVGGSEQAHAVYRHLVVKYFKGTPLERAIIQKMPSFESDFAAEDRLVIENPLSPWSAKMQSAELRNTPGKSEKEISTSPADNFFELRTQLEDQGFRDAGLLNALREKVSLADEAIFSINYREKLDDQEMRTWFEYGQIGEGSIFRLMHVSSMLSWENESLQHAFQRDVTRNEMMAFLYYEKANDRYNMWDEHRVSRAEIQGTALPVIVEHGNYYGVDTRQLDEKMGKVNWQQHPGHFFYNKDDPTDLQLKEMRRLEKELDKIGLIDGQNPAIQVWEHLMVKHFKDTPLEKALSESAPYLEASFADKSSKIIIHHLNNKVMNTQNAEFLKRALLNLGFGEQLNNELDKQMANKSPEFKLNAQQEYNGQKVDYLLHFKAGKNTDIYFFNKYDAAYQKEKGKDQHQSFYINKGNGVTAKEAYNLMEGRSVFKQLVNKQDEKYHAWVKLDPKDLTEGGNQRIKQFSFDLEKFLDGKGIKQMENQSSKEDLIRSLKKGNRQQVSVEMAGKETRYFISANPQFKTIDLFDDKMKKIKREQLVGDGAPGKTEHKSEKQKEEQSTKKHNKGPKVGS